MWAALVAAASRLFAFIRRRRLDEDVRQDCETHLDLLTERNIRAGMAPEEARAAAQRQFGNATLLREEIYRMNRIAWIEVLVQDLRYAIRSLRRSPAFTLAAVLTLVIGIGATTAIFTAVDAVLLRPLPFPHPEQLISVTTRVADGPVSSAGISPVELAALKSPALPVVGASAVMSRRPELATVTQKDGTPMALVGSAVSEDFFQVLGTPMVLGRPFSHEDFFQWFPNAGPMSVVLSYHLWTDLFDRDPTVIGKPLPLSGRGWEGVIVGVAAPEMNIPAGTDFWNPWIIQWSGRQGIGHDLQGIVDPGFTASGRLVMSTSVSLRPPKESWAEFRAMLQRIRAIPGVSHAGAAITFPMLADRAATTHVTIRGEAPLDPTGAPDVYTRVVTADFFRAMGIKLIAGRDFTADDRQDTEPVAIVNRTFVRDFLSGRDPLGASFGCECPIASPHVIVGIVNDVRYQSLTAAPQPTLYLAVSQEYVPIAGPIVVIAARAGNPLALVSPVRSAVKAVAPEKAVQFETAEDVLSATLTRQRLGMRLMVTFGVVALLLAAIGIYGVIAYVAAQRREEIAIRIALGASSSRVFWFVMNGGQRLTAIGVVLGVAAAYAGGLTVASRVYAMRADDPLILAASAAVVAAVALLATLIPAIRASRLDPARILRSE